MAAPFLQLGWHEPFGAQLRDGGVNFAVLSEHATAIEVCVFDADGRHELARHRLHGPQDGVFHGFLPDADVGLVYGLRAYGPYSPEQGQRFNPHKLLLDPYAREIVGRFDWRAEHHGFEMGHADGARSLDTRDNAAHALKARVAPPDAYRPARRPRRAVADLVLYEVHVKGFSMLHPGLPPALRGSYAGMAHPASIAHFKQLGVNTLSLLPVHYAVDEAHLAPLGLTNYWGYNSLGFFCPDPRLAQEAHRHDPSRVNAEFRAMVDALHAADIEVVLDVVYNHTPEGSELGPTLSFRGLDNRSWYRLVPDEPSRYENHSGCGNVLQVHHPRVTQFVLDSLRYWVEVMGVDGFRFDLAPALGRTPFGFDTQAAFFTALKQDPVLAGVHLIAEPWDLGPDGYQVGRFPGRFLEWNDKFRDTVRSYWLRSGTGVGRGELVRRFMASSDMFHHGTRQPTASVNFIAAHDGFTLLDATSYSRKHNLANGEENRDGRDGEICCNFGAEGPTQDPAVRNARRRAQRAMLATLLLAQGTPMLAAGDEIGRTQGGNNNAYCQDNPISWLDWSAADTGTLDFVSALLALRRDEPLLRHAQWFAAATPPPGEAAVRWYAPSGHEMQGHDWHRTDQLAFAAQLSEPDAALPRLMIVFNPEREALPFLLCFAPWQLLLDSSGELSPGSRVAVGQPLAVPARSVLVLRRA